MEKSVEVQVIEVVNTALVVIGCVIRIKSFDCAEPHISSTREWTNSLFFLFFLEVLGKVQCEIYRG